MCISIVKIRLYRDVIIRIFLRLISSLAGGFSPLVSVYYQAIPNSLPHKLVNSSSVSVELLVGPAVSPSRTFSAEARLSKLKPYLQDYFNNEIVILQINTAYNFRYLTRANTVTLTGFSQSVDWVERDQTDFWPHWPESACRRRQI